MCNERVTSVVLIECGLIWREWLGLIKKDLLEKGVLRLGLKRGQRFSNEGTRTTLGAQQSWRCSDYASGIPCRRYHFNVWS